jgi:spore maturation protein SpmB
MKTMKRINKSFLSIALETWMTSRELMKIMIPAIIATKILKELGGISYLSIILEPLMSFIGLPGSLGFVWAVALLTGPYSAVAVFAVLAPGLGLTVAQITVLCSAMLIAHSLPVELSISKKAGANLIPIALLRLVGAVVYAFLLNKIFLVLDLWQNQAVVFFKSTAGSENLQQWGVEQIQNLGLIILIIFCIFVIMRFLKTVGLLGLIERLLAPVLPFLGMGRHAAPVTVVGMIMGLGYGGALIIRETSTGKLNREEVFNSMALMGLCHGLVEDTLLMVAIGGKLAGILWGRIIFSLIVIFFIVKFMGFIAGKRLQHQT